VEGANGSGKTSLLRMLCGLTQPDAGTIYWQGEDIGKLGETYRAQMVYLGHQNALKDDLSGVENLQFYVALRGGRLSAQQALAALARLGVERGAHLPTRALSQGQKRRVALARLIFHRASPLWLLDEAFVALDRSAIEEVARLIGEQLAAGGVVLYTTHQDIAIDAPLHQSLRLQ
jgi:heme exporter protein A